MTTSRPRATRSGLARNLTTAAALVGAIGALGACGGSAPSARAPATETEAADVIYVGRHLYTMRREGETVEAVAVKGGRIVALGTEASVRAVRGPRTRREDLGDRALLPGFFDGHGHFLDVGARLHTIALAPPPLGEVRTIPDLVARLHEAATAETDPEGWIVGTGYDDAALAENRHPTRQELDAATGAHPTVILHASGHFAVGNSAALAKVGWTRTTRNPPGGNIVRDRRGEPTGVAEEAAVFVLRNAVPTPPLETRLAYLRDGEDRYLRAGYTTAHDGPTSRAGLELVAEADRRGVLRADVVTFPLASARDAFPTERYAELATYGTRHYRVDGFEIVLDGSPQGRSAFLTAPYLTPPAGERRGFRGHGNLDDAEVNRWVEAAYAANVGFQAHCNGDAAADQLIGAVRRARAAHAGTTLRPVMLHALVLRDEQLDAMKELEILPSFFAAQVYVWGDYYRDVVLGPERAARLAPAGSAASRGVRFAAHNDAPVTPPDPMALVYTMVTRRTASGQVLGETQRISRFDALRAVTIEPAYLHHEDAEKGTLDVGKRADFVVLASDPFTVAEDALRTLGVVRTIVRGEVVYDAAANSHRSALQ